MLPFTSTLYHLTQGCIFYYQTSSTWIVQKDDKLHPNHTHGSCQNRWCRHAMNSHTYIAITLKKLLPSLGTHLPWVLVCMPLCPPCPHAWICHPLQILRKMNTIVFTINVCYLHWNTWYCQIFATGMCTDFQMRKSMLKGNGSNCSP